MSKAEKKTKPLLLAHPSTLPGRDKLLGGSMHDGWNNIISTQVCYALRPIENKDWEHEARTAALQGLMGIAPRDELEGMLAAQLIACHHASMECYKRAMILEQTFVGREQNLNHANKLSRTYSTLLEALNRHRGKGQQKMTVEHVHVHEGGQAIVGNVESQGGGFAPKTEEQPYALGYAPGQTLPSANTPREPVSVTGDEERSMPDARRNVTGRTEGKS